MAYEKIGGDSLIDANVKRDILRRTILEMLERGNVNYTILEKKVCSICYPFITINTFKPQLQYLVENKFVNRISRGVYQVTNKGLNYLDLLK
jgi:predicted transcriptional regulator